MLMMIGFVMNIPWFTCSLSKPRCYESKYYICTSGANTSSREYFDEKSGGYGHSWDTESFITCKIFYN